MKKLTAEEFKKYRFYTDEQLEKIEKELREKPTARKLKELKAMISFSLSGFCRYVNDGEVSKDEVIEILQGFIDDIKKSGVEK